MLLLALLALLRPLVLSPAVEDPLALIDATLIDVEAGEAIPGRTVLVADGRIRWVGPTAEAEIPADARRVDAAGRYLMPGLWDMHVHLGAPWDDEVSLPLFLAHGVTGVRDMSSDAPPDEDPHVGLDGLLRWRTAIERGELAGPRLLSLSSWPISRDEQLGADVGAQLDELRARGVDMVKILQGLSPEGFRRLMTAARERRMPVAGHVPLAVGLGGVAEQGLASVEHARDVLFDGFRGAELWRSRTDTQNPPTDILRLMIDHHDPELLRPLARAMASAGTAYVPTHVTRRFDALADDPEFLADPRERFVAARRWDDWRADAASVLRRDASVEGRRAFREMHATGLAATRVLLDEGVRVLVGTDANDSYAFPGSGVHEELAELVRAGLTPAEALAAATLEPARFLDREEDFGGVTVGRRADLLLLDADPLADVANAAAIHAVVFDGRLQERARLDELLAAAERRVAELDPSVEVAPQTLARLVGSYGSPMGAATITREGDALFLRLGSRGGLRLRPLAEDSWVHLPRDLRLRAELDGEGPAPAFVITVDGREVRAERLDEGG